MISRMFGRLACACETLVAKTAREISAIVRSRDWQRSARTLVLIVENLAATLRGRRNKAPPEDASCNAEHKDCVSARSVPAMLLLLHVTRCYSKPCSKNSSCPCSRFDHPHRG